MLNISSKSHCDTFTGARLPTPLLIGLEFARKPRPSAQNDWQQLEQLKAERGWQFDLEAARPYLEGTLSAVVVTNLAQQITWVSRGFTRMTGYGARESYNRSPRFLQGEKTLPEIRQEIRRRLTRQETFEGTLVNYRKSGVAYACEVRIFPVLDGQNQLVNFIALEKEAEPLA